MQELISFIQTLAEVLHLKNAASHFLSLFDFQHLQESLPSFVKWLTLSNILYAAAFAFFFVTVAVFLWRIYLYMNTLKKAVHSKKISFAIIIQSLVTLYLVVITMLSAGINGWSGIFWVFSFIGFCLTFIFLLDRASKKGHNVPD